VDRTISRASERLIFVAEVCSRENTLRRAEAANVAFKRRLFIFLEGYRDES